MCDECYRGGVEGTLRRDCQEVNLGPKTSWVMTFKLIWEEHEVAHHSCIKAGISFFLTLLILGLWLGQPGTLSLQISVLTSPRVCGLPVLHLVRTMGGKQFCLWPWLICSWFSLSVVPVIISVPFTRLSSLSRLLMICHCSLKLPLWEFK